jgi:hypothetical protein
VRGYILSARRPQAAIRLTKGGSISRADQKHMFGQQFHRRVTDIDVKPCGMWWYVYVPSYIFYLQLVRSIYSYLVIYVLIYTHIVHTQYCIQIDTNMHV